MDATGTAVLAGIVVADDEPARPVRRAAVTVSGVGLADRVLLSDGEGRFAFTGLPAGTYALTVRKPGSVTGYYGSRVSWHAPGVPLVLGDGERRTDLELRLPRGAAISGRLVDEFGQPLTGARVVAFRRERQAGRDTFVMRASLLSVTRLTDDRGAFRLAELPPGDYIVGANLLFGPVGARATTTAAQIRWAEQVARTGRVAAGRPPPRGEAVDHQPTYFPGVTNPARATVLTLGPGEERDGVDFQLGFVRSVAVTGILRLPDGQPAAGMAVHFLPADGPIVGSNFLSSPRRSARTGSNGTFAFQSVPPGDHVLLARGAASQAHPLLWARTPLSVGTADVSGIEVRLQPGLRITGTLTTVLGPAERPDFMNIVVGVLPEDDGGPAVRVPPAPAAADGTFEIGGLPPGRYLLTASFPGVGRPGGPAWIPNRAVIDGRDALRIPFELSVGRDVGDVVIELADRPATLTGTATDAAGRPVSGLTMVVFPTDRANWAVSGDERSRRTAPLDDSGRYRFAAMPAGEYYLAAVAEGTSIDLADPAFLEQLSGNAVSIALVLGQDTMQDIRLGGG